MTSHNKEQPLGYCVSLCLTVNCLYCHGLLGPQGLHCPAHVATFKTPSGCHGEGVPAQPPEAIMGLGLNNQWEHRPVARSQAFWIQRQDAVRVKSGGLKWEEICAPLTLTFCFLYCRDKHLELLLATIRLLEDKVKKSQNDMFVCYFLWNILGHLF